MSVLSRAQRGAVIVAKKFTMPSNCRKAALSLGNGTFTIALTLAGYGLNPSLLTMVPKYLTELTHNKFVHYLKYLGLLCGRLSVTSEFTSSFTEG